MILWESYDGKSHLKST